MVFPTCVGVFLDYELTGVGVARLPHVRGGVSKDDAEALTCDGSSPRAWGCFISFILSWMSVIVFPTCVGVFLGEIAERFRSVGLPHVRGGVSPTSGSVGKLSGSSPRAWGCFPEIISDVVRLMIFPTCVGVFLAKALVDRLGDRLPHVRGGVSVNQKSLQSSSGSSPRAWGCFFSSCSATMEKKVFPTCVGVFLLECYYFCRVCGLPHVRGGVSKVV